jgi:hypothetical protein
MINPVFEDVHARTVARGDAPLVNGRHEQEAPLTVGFADRGRVRRHHIRNPQSWG